MLKTVSSPARLRALLAVAAVVLVVGIVVAVSSGGGGSGSGPMTGAASVVPADALAYVHLSTDGSLPGVKSALALAGRFPDYPVVAAELNSRLASLVPVGAPFSYTDDIRPWLGQEVAIALLNTPTNTAEPLIVVGVADRARAQSFLTRIGTTKAASYRGVQLLSRDAAHLAFVGSYLVIGSAASVRAAIDVANAGAPSLAANGPYKQASDGEPIDRVLDAYVSAAGLRRLLISQGGLAGALGVLLYQNALTGVSVSVSAAPPGARVSIHRALDPSLAAIAAPPAREFTPTLEGDLPAGSTLALDVTGLDRVAPRVLDAGATGGVGGAVGPLLSRLGDALKAQGVNVAGLESIFSGESAVAIAPTPGHPSALVIIARPPNVATARTDLAALEVPLSQLLATVSTNSGVVTSFSERVVDGVTAHQLPLASGVELDYAVFRGLVVISTSLGGIEAVASRGPKLSDKQAYRSALSGRPPRVTSLLFLDFSQLLSLAEQTGLIRGALFSALRADLQKISAIGLASTGGEADSTAELSLQIP